MIVLYDAAVRTDGHIDPRLLEILIPRARHLDHRRRLPAADPLGLARDTDGAAADADLDKVRARVRQEAEPLPIHDVARADPDRLAIARADERERILLPLGIALGRIDAQHVRARFDQRRDARLIVARVDAGAHDVPFLRIQKFERVFLVRVVILAEDKRDEPPVRGNDRQRIELVLPDDVVCGLERRAFPGVDEPIKRRHERAHRRLRRHAAHAVIAACDDAHQPPGRRAVLGDGHGRMPRARLEREHVLQRIVRAQVGIARHKPRLVALDPAHHLRLLFNRLRRIQEGDAALPRKRNGHPVVRHRLHDGGYERDVHRDRALLPRNRVTGVRSDTLAGMQSLDE